MILIINKLFASYIQRYSHHTDHEWVQ